MRILNYPYFFRLLLFATCYAGTGGGEVFAQQSTAMSFPQVLQRVVDHYPTLTVAALQVERAHQEVMRVESTLGWNLTGQGGVNRDVGIFGSTSNIADVGASLDRRLRSGSSVGLSGKYEYQDDTVTFSPSLPNPSQRTRLDLNYRMPFAKGKDNPGYQQGLISAEASTLLEQANYLAVRDQLANQTLELYYSAAQILARLETAKSAVERAQRLKKYIAGRTTLGLSERKDVLQAEAQYRSRISDVKTLQVSWQQTRTSLNRLMGRDWNADFRPRLETVMPDKSWHTDMPAMVEQAQANSADILRDKARIKLSEADIALRQNNRKEQFDVVLSLGTRTNSGSSSLGQVSSEEVAGGVRLEYKQALDKRGFDAAIYQAQLDKQIAEEDSRRIEEDLRYQVAGLVAQIEANQQAVKSQRARLKSEESKFKDALQRYQQGRTETDRLIQFENELQTARFALQDQKIAYQKRYHDLTILRGQIWQVVNLNRDGK